MNPEGAVSVTLPPSQNVVGALIAMIGSVLGNTFTWIVSELLEQPFSSVTVHQYLPVVRTTMLRAVSPVFQMYEEKPIGALRVTSPPWQNVVWPEAVRTAFGRALTVTLIVFRTVQRKPFTSVTVSVAAPGSVHSTVTFGVP